MPVFDFLNDIDLTRQKVEQLKPSQGRLVRSGTPRRVKMWETRSPAPKLDEVTEQCQPVPQRWLLSAMYYRRRLEFIQAEYCLDALLSAMPDAKDDVNVIFHYGDTLKELGKFAEAETWFLRGVAQSPRQPLFRRQLVDVMKELNRDPAEILVHAEAIPDDESLQESARELKSEIERAKSTGQQKEEDS